MIDDRENLAKLANNDQNWQNWTAVKNKKWTSSVQLCADENLLLRIEGSLVTKSLNLVHFIFLIYRLEISKAMNV